MLIGKMIKCLQISDLIRRRVFYRYEKIKKFDALFIQMICIQKSLQFQLTFRNCLMSSDPSNGNDAECLYNEALRLDPSNETVLTMFAIFKCNRSVNSY